ncbi:MAG: transcriptional regulator [Thermogutta sp.]|nr:MAG: transcriptional regulator [Thermogutta sp.]
MTQPQPARTTDTSTTIPAELQELAAAIERLPAPYREALRPAFDKVVDANRRRRQILSLVQDALAELRLDMKYLLFDLEATRRERDEYKRQLDELRRGD